MAPRFIPHRHHNSSSRIDKQLKGFSQRNVNMVLPSSGPISFSQLSTEYKLNKPISVSDIQQLNIHGVPTVGPFSMSILIVNSYIYPTRQIEEVGGIWTSSTVSYFWMYRGNAEYMVNGKSLLIAFQTCSSFRIVNWKGVVGQTSPFVFVTGVTNPRTGNHEQLQVDFSPAMIMNPYQSTTFEMRF